MTGSIPGREISTRLQREAVVVGGPGEDQPISLPRIVQRRRAPHEIRNDRQVGRDDDGQWVLRTRYVTAPTGEPPAGNRHGAQLDALAVGV